LNQPLVSVVTPSLNQGRFLEEAILSVRRQDYPRIEHIVVDGGSSDATPEILRRYGEASGLRWTSAPDSGQAAAVNKGFGLVHGEIVGWLNADDAYFDTGAVRAAAEALAANPSVDVVYGDIAFIAEDGRLLRVQCVPRFSASRLRRGCFIHQPAVFLRRRVVERHRLDESLTFAMDYDLWLRLSRESAFKRLPAVLAADRHHPGRKMVAGWDRLVRERTDVQVRYGAPPGRLSSARRLLDRATSGLPRRLKGMRRFLALRRKSDFAFAASLPPLRRMVETQLLRGSFLNLLPRDGSRP
jgi:glycosyltransferase involved in cell wall biosynthesis